MLQRDLLQAQLSTESCSHTEGKEHQREGAPTRVAFAQLHAFSGEWKMSHPGTSYPRLSHPRSRAPGQTRWQELWSLQLGRALPGAASSLEHLPLMETCGKARLWEVPEHPHPPAACACNRWAAREEGGLRACRWPRAMGCEMFESSQEWKKIP